MTLYYGDALEIAGTLRADTIVTDPPYGETSFSWDRWPSEWPGAFVGVAPSLWCFGSLRVFFGHLAEFSTWKLAQDVAWEKHNGSSFVADRFRRVHELALHFYRGRWSDLYHEVPTTLDAKARSVKRAPTAAAWHGARTRTTYVSTEGGPRLMRSVIKARSEHRRAANETQKPLGVVAPLVSYSCPPGGVVLDPFAGSGTTLVAAKTLRRHAIGIEVRESQCEVAARRCEKTRASGIEPWQQQLADTKQTCPPA